MKYFAYCPVLREKDECFQVAKDLLKDNQVVIVTHGIGPERLHIKILPFTSEDADNYGHDLYLYEVDDKNELKYLDCGSFE